MHPDPEVTLMMQLAQHYPRQRGRGRPLRQPAVELVGGPADGEIVELPEKHEASYQVPVEGKYQDGQAIVSFTSMTRPLLAAVDPTPAKLRMLD